MHTTFRAHKLAWENEKERDREREGKKLSHKICWINLCHWFSCFFNSVISRSDLWATSNKTWQRIQNPFGMWLQCCALTRTCYLYSNPKWQNIVDVPHFNSTSRLILSFDRYAVQLATLTSHHHFYLSSICNNSRLWPPLDPLSNQVPIRNSSEKQLKHLRFAVIIEIAR